MDSTTKWHDITPNRATALTDARLQLHYAAQFGTALGISFLPKQDDDSHTNLGWDPALGALMSREAPAGAGGVAVGVRAADLTLLVATAGRVPATIPLDGLAVEEAAASIRDALAATGLDAARYTLDRHYDLPPHILAGGAPFTARDAAAFGELGRWFGNAALVLDRVARDTRGASEVRVWPHHFDIATLVSLRGGATTGAGLSPGDQYYDEPYFYVNAHPQPAAEKARAMTLAGGGSWHAHEWVGAVLPGSRLGAGGAAQQDQVREFLATALAACGKLAAG